MGQRVDPARMKFSAIKLSLFKNLIICLVLFNFLLISLVGSVAAQTTDGWENQTSEQTSAPETNPPTLTPQTTTANQVALTHTQAQVESGQVLGIDLEGVFNAVTGVASGVTDLPGKIAGAISSFLLDHLFDLVAKIILYVTHIFWSILGGNIDKSDVCNKPDEINAEECYKTLSALSEVDPLFAMDTSVFSRTNLFTFADASIASVYGSIPRNNTSTYLAETVNSSLLGVKEAHAQTQSEGTDLINRGVIKKAWQSVANLAYVGMVIILIGIGFMVMLRKRLDPRTVVTASSALPKVALALILIVFSFAISGLFFDMIFVFYELIRSWASGLGGSGVTALKNISDGATIAGKQVGNAGELFWFPFFTLASASVISFKGFLSVLAAVIVGTGGTGGIVVIILLIAFFAFDLIIRLSIFLIAVILFWILFLRFVSMIVMTIFSPVFFLVGALPGFEQATLSWFKRMFASVLVFPITLALVYLAIAFMNVTSARFLASLTVVGAPLQGLVPGTILGSPPPVQGGGFFLNVSTLIGLGFILFAVKVPGFIDELFGNKDFTGRGGLGAGLLFGSLGIPLLGLKALGDVGKTAGGIQQLGGSVGKGANYARNVGWGARPPLRVETNPTTGVEEVVRGPAPETGVGTLQRMARGAYRGTPLRSFGKRPAPWEEIRESKATYDARRAAQAAAQRGNDLGREDPTGDTVSDIDDTNP